MNLTAFARERGIFPFCGKTGPTKPILNANHNVNQGCAPARKVIPEGQRNSTLSHFAGRVLKKFGTSDEKAYNLFMDEAAKCVPPLRMDELFEIWHSALNFFKKVEAEPDYIAPEEYVAKKTKSISHHTVLSKVYISEHKYVVGVQKLCRGGNGNDTVYEYKGGVWLPQSDTDVKSVLAKRVISAGGTPDPKEIDKAYRVILMSGARKDIEDFGRTEDLVCFQNGVYRLSDGAILPHSPDYYFSIMLNANIPSTLSETPYCDLCMKNFGGAEEYELLLQIFGAAISNVNCSRFKKAFLHYGAGDSGKTQLKTFAERVLGPGNYNNVDLSDLESNRFLPAAFQNVRLGGSNDLSNQKIREVKIFKQLTGGDSIQAENKGEKGFTFHYKGILWFLSNPLPLFGGDKGDHVYERWIIMKCEKSIPIANRNKELGDLMFAERDSFCMKALAALQRAISNNYTFSIPESCKRANEEYKRKNSVVRTFIDECCEKRNTEGDTKNQTSTGKFWQAFRNFCSENNYYLPGKGEFKRELAIIAGVDEESLVYRNKDGGFYPYTLSEDYIKEEFPCGIPGV